MRVHLLASGYHWPKNGQLGSGIYGPLGPINYTFNPDSGTRLVTAEIPTSGQQAESKDDFVQQQQERSLEPHGLFYENMTGYSNLLLETGQDRSVSLCHGDLCCTLSYSSSCPTADCVSYRLLAYSGFRGVAGEYTMAIQLCGVVACADEDSVDSCGQQSVVNRTVDFVRNAFHLEGNFSSARHVYPTATTSSNLQLLPAGSIRLNIAPSAGGITIVGLSGNDDDRGAVFSDLLSIGLYGRAYEKDPAVGNHVMTSSESWSYFSFFDIFDFFLLKFYGLD